MQSNRMLRYTNLAKEGLFSVIRGREEGKTEKGGLKTASLCPTRKNIIEQLLTVDKAFYRYYLEMLLTVDRTHALISWQMSILLWRSKLFRVTILYPELPRVSICTEQEKDEIRFMKGWKLNLLKKVLHVFYPSKPRFFKIFSEKNFSVPIKPVPLPLHISIPKIG